MLARSDRLFVKQFEEETNLRAMLLVDASRSMAWRGAPARLPKRAEADRPAAALARIPLRQRDATGLVTVDDGRRPTIPPLLQTGQWSRAARVRRGSSLAGGGCVPGAASASPRRGGLSRLPRRRGRGGRLAPPPAAGGARGGGDPRAPPPAGPPAPAG